MYVQVLIDKTDALQEGAIYEAKHAMIWNGVMKCFENVYLIDNFYAVPKNHAIEVSGYDDEDNLTNLDEVIENEHEA